MPAARKLNEKQQAFVDEYIIDFNITQAARRAGYSEKTAAQQGSRLLRDVKIHEAIQKAVAERSERTKVTADRVVNELAKIGFSNMADFMRVTPEGDPYLDLSNLTREQTAALSEVTVEDYVEGRGDDARQVRKVKAKLCDKRAALVDLGKHLGIFTDKLEVNANIRDVTSAIKDRKQKARERLDAK